MFAHSPARLSTGFRKKTFSNINLYKCMEKKSDYSERRLYCILSKQTIRVMKLTTLFTLMTIFQLYASDSYSQLTKITLKVENDKISDVLKKIETQSEFYFLYSPKLIDVERKVNIDANNKYIQDVLATMFDGKVNYTVYDRQIILTPIIESGVSTLPLPQKITGTVTDLSNGQTMPGVSVIIKGTILGTITDADGKYALEVTDPNAVLVFSFIGYKTKDVLINNQSVINVILEQNAVGLEEVVVVGYGTVKRKDLTGSVASISDSKIADRAITSLGEAMVGLIPGLDIVSSGGLPGATSSILLRGKRSFQASNDPLVILDGMPFYGNMNDINPFDVKSIDVLKDASSTSIYGSRGANGVIIITTKRGQVSKPSISFESSAGPEVMYGRIPLAQGPEYAEWAREAFRTMGGYPAGTVPDPAFDAIIFDVIELPNVLSGTKGTDYLKELLQNGFMQRHQLSVSGGTEAIKYNLAGNYLKQEGLQPGDVFSRFTLNTNFDIKISSKITAGASIQLGKSTNRKIAESSALDRAIAADPLGQLRNKDGNILYFINGDNLEYNPMVSYWYDAYRYERLNYSVFINSYGEYKILPTLTYRISLGYNVKMSNTGESAGSNALSRSQGLPTASVSGGMNNYSLYQSTLTYNKTFHEKHNLTLTAVQEIQNSLIQSTGANVTDLPYENSRYYNMGTANTINSVASDRSELYQLSYVGRMNYGYKSKYLLTVSFRADAASQFAPGHKWGYFPSASVAYRITEEKFMAGTKSWLSDLKLRLGYGVTGNQAISPYQTQGGLARSTYDWNDKAGFGYRPLNLANKNLKWESTEVYNLGLDFALFKSRITGNIDFYNTNTFDLLMYRKLPITTGYDQVLENVGSSNNKGFELGFHSTNITRNNFLWSTDLSFYTNKTRITELYNGKIDDVGNLWFIGHPIDVYYDYEKIGIWQLGEEAAAAKYGLKPGQIKLTDVNNDGKYNASDMMILGDNEPDFVVNLSNQFKYKSFDISVSAYFRIGGMTSVGQFAPFSKKRYNKIIFDYWTPDNPTNDYPRPNQLYEGSGLYGSTLTYRSASYANISQVGIGYSFPVALLSRMNISKARVYLSAANPFYWTASELARFNMKPDWSGTTVGTYPATRKITMGINLVF